MAIKKWLIFVVVIGGIAVLAFAPNELKNKFLSSDVLQKITKVEEPQWKEIPAPQKISLISSDWELILEWDPMIPGIPYYNNIVPTEYIVEYKASWELKWSTLIWKFINKKSDTNDEDQFNINKDFLSNSRPFYTVIPNLQNGNEYIVRISLKNKFLISNPSKEVTWTPTLSSIRQDMKFPVHKFQFEASNNWAENIIAVDRVGNIYFPALQRQWINKYDSTGKFLMNIGKWLFKDWYSTSIKIDSKGNIYVTKNGDGGLVNSLLKFSPSGENIMIIKNSNGKEKYYLYWAWDVEIDKDGNIYIVNGGYIQKFDKNWNFIMNIGAPRWLKENQLADTRTIDLDIFWDIYVLDDWARNGKWAIKKFDPTGKFLWILEFKKSDDIQFDGMEKLENIDDFGLDGKNNIYISDNWIIKKFNSEWKFLAKSSCNIKNQGCATDIAVSSGGDIFTSDRRKFTIDD